MEATIDRRRYPILIVDDDADLVATFSHNFEEEFTVLEATNGRQALEIVEREPVAVLVADQRMPDLHGVEVIRRALELRPTIVPIVLTGFTDYQALVRAINVGRIYRYIAKPWNADELRLTLTTAIEACHLAAENARLVAELAAANERLEGENRFFKQRETARSEFDGLVGNGPAMERVRHLVRLVLDVDTTVLLEGETGTGKELIARAIHYGGARRDRLFVPVNCASMPDTLLHSELFGHRRGAFTGATSDRKGLFQVAGGGTIFLDEIGKAGLGFQEALLRALEVRRIRPLGQDSEEVPVDVRVIAATNRNLDQEVAAGRFLEDLLYRLRVFPIRLPPLAERREDISALVQHFLRRHAAAQKRPVPELSPEAAAELYGREYRGNVRELSNLIERALLLSSPGSPIALEHLFDGPMPPAPNVASAAPLRLSVVVAAREREHIAAVLAKNGGRRKATAADLGITTHWLRAKMRRLGMLEADDDESDDPSP